MDNHPLSRLDGLSRLIGLATATLLLAGPAAAAVATPLERCIEEIRSDLVNADTRRLEHRVTRQQRQGAWEDFVIRSTAWTDAGDSPDHAVRYHCQAHRFAPTVRLGSTR